MLLGWAPRIAASLRVLPGLFSYEDAGLLRATPLLSECWAGRFLSILIFFF